MEHEKNPNYEGETSKGTIVRSNKRKRLRMRMYADDEEKKRKRSCRHNESGRRSVHSRLGTKYTREEFFQHRNRFSSESEEEDDNSKNYEAPSRLWTDIDKFMAKDISSSHSNSPDLRKFRNRATQDRSSDSDQGSPESARGSRPWRPSRNESSQDFGSLKSRKGQSPLNRPHEDLHPEFKRIKKGTAKKHRSPMFLDD